MKKILILAMMAALVIAAAASAEDYDFSGKTTAELIEIQQKVNEALWKSDGWNEVTVPAGVYEIGKEIPAGEWMIAPATTDMTKIGVYKENKGGELKGSLVYNYIEKPQKVTLYEGNFLEVGWQPVIISTYVPSFNFK